MSQQPNPPGMQRGAAVAHYAVQPQAYNGVLQILGQLPYQQVAGVIQQLQAQTHAVYAEPPQGKIDRSGGKTPAKPTPPRKARKSKPLNSKPKEV